MTHLPSRPSLLIRQLLERLVPNCIAVAFALALALALATSVPARAQPSPPAPDSPPPPAAGADDEALAKAKDLFRHGVTLFNAGDVERALDFFLRSRAAYASAKNTTNAAICLDRLGRYDEALEMYEEVLLRFSSELAESDRAAIAPAMAALRQKVGSVDVQANVDGAAIVIDGRARGKVPLTTPIRVLAGSRLVRVTKSGYLSFEKRITVEAGQAVRIDARLEPLAATGLLRVEDPDSPGSEVFVDGASVGAAPWEGTLGPGSHVVWTHKGDVGSAPTRVIVVQGQTALVRLRSSRLGPPARIEVEPRTASIALDGADLGRGAFEGRLPPGTYSFLISEDGYHPQTRKLVVSAGDGAPQRIQVRLAIDPDHPRWPKVAKGELSVELFGGLALAPTLGAQAEEGCPDACSDDSLATGMLAGARAAYRFPFGVALELGGGFVAIQKSVSRTVTARWGPSQGNVAVYDLDDELSLAGPYVLAGASYRLGSRFGLVPRVSVGLVFAGSRDSISAEASGGGQTLPASLQNGSATARSANVFVAPEIGGDLRLGSFRVGLSVVLGVFVVDGPALEHGALRVPPDTCGPANPAAIACAPASGVVDGERAYGPFVTVMPEAHVTYVF